jgi:hypothetical protein
MELEQPTHKIKQSLLRYLYDWMIVLGNFPSFPVLEFVDSLSFKL